MIGKDFPQDYFDLFTEREIDIAGIKREQGDIFIGAAVITKTSISAIPSNCI